MPPRRTMAPMNSNAPLTNNNATQAGPYGGNIDTDSNAALQNTKQSARYALSDHTARNSRGYASFFFPPARSSNQVYDPTTGITRVRVWQPDNMAEDSTKPAHELEGDNEDSMLSSYTIRHHFGDGTAQFPPAANPAGTARDWFPRSRVTNTPVNATVTNRPTPTSETQSVNNPSDNGRSTPPDKIRFGEKLQDRFQYSMRQELSWIHHDMAEMKEKLNVLESSATTPIAGENDSTIASPVSESDISLELFHLRQEVEALTERVGSLEEKGEARVRMDLVRARNERRVWLRIGRLERLVLGGGLGNGEVRRLLRRDDGEAEGPRARCMGQQIGTVREQFSDAELQNMNTVPGLKANEETDDKAIEGWRRFLKSEEHIQAEEQANTPPTTEQNHNILTSHQTQLKDLDNQSKRRFWRTRPQDVPILNTPCQPMFSTHSQNLWAPSNGSSNISTDGTGTAAPEPSPTHTSATTHYGPVHFHPYLRHTAPDTDTTRKQTLPTPQDIPAEQWHTTFPQRRNGISFHCRNIFNNSCGGNHNTPKPLSIPNRNMTYTHDTTTPSQAQGSSTTTLEDRLKQLKIGKYRYQPTVTEEVDETFVDAVEDLDGAVDVGELGKSVNTWENRCGFGGVLGTGKGSGAPAGEAEEGGNGGQSGIIGYGGKMYRRPCITGRADAKGEEGAVDGGGHRMLIWN